jgi:hypothetical protein
MERAGRATDLREHAERATEEVRAKRAGLDDEDADPERRDLGGEAFGEAFEAMFHCAVGSEARCSGESADARDLDDGTAAALSHVRKDGARGSDGAEEHRLECSPKFLVRGLLHRAQDAVARVVDEDVDLAEALEGPRECSRGLVFFYYPSRAQIAPKVQAMIDFFKLPARVKRR